MATTISNPAKIRTDKAACHHQLSAQVFGTEKEGEPDGQKGAAEKHHPDDRGHNAIGQDTSFAPSLTDAIDVP
jgi:hypothetical protein